MRTKAAKTVRLAAASGSPLHVEGDARLAFVRDGKKCNMKFLDADVERPLASVSAIVDEGNVVVFGPQESHIEHTSIGQRIPMNRRQGVFVVQLDAREGTRSMTTVRFDEPNTYSVFRRPATKVRKKCVNAVRSKQKLMQERKHA